MPPGMLERRWEQQEEAHRRALAVAVARTAALLAAVHYSRSLAHRRGWEPWRAALAHSQQHIAAADTLHARNLLARALEAWRRCRMATAWLALASEACMAAMARRFHQQALQRHALSALQQHALWARSLACLHVAHLAAAALHCWRQQAAVARQHMQRTTAAAAAHCARCLRRRALGAWRKGAVAQRRERLAARRLDDKWGTVQQMLAEAREQRRRKQQLEEQGSSGWSSAENSFDPNTLFR